ncbi:MAG: hypothetical protein U5Q44_09190 [Dehalococcoidia bacterium]|nr:hypothetical protein [Dehalococcoidia bacterium]
MPLPELTAGILEGSDALQSIALQLANASHMLVLGRGMTCTESRSRAPSR